MSSRVLKKLVQIQEPSRSHDEDEIDDLESDSEIVVPNKKQLNINRYDLVSDLMPKWVSK